MNPDQWVAQYGDFLYRYAYVRLRDKARAEDAVQETFLAAIKARERFKEGQSERAWLVGILRHKVIDTIRKSAREVSVEDTEAADFENSALFKVAGIPSVNQPRWKFSPRKALEQKEFWDVFSGCLTKLKNLMHSSFVLKELEGWTTEETCKELGINANHLWVLIHRARAQLKTCLEANWERHAGERD